MVSEKSILKGVNYEETGFNGSGKGRKAQTAYRNQTKNTDAYIGATFNMQAYQ